LNQVIRYSTSAIPRNAPALARMDQQDEIEAHFFLAYTLTERDGGDM